MAWVLEGDSAHAKLLGWFEHLRLIVDEDALDSGMGSFRQGEFVYLRIRFSQSDPMRENTVLEAVKKPVCVFEVVDPLLDIIREKEHFIASCPQPVDEGYRAFDGLVRMEPGAGDLVGGNLQISVLFRPVPELGRSYLAAAVATAELTHQYVADSICGDLVCGTYSFDCPGRAIGEIHSTQITDDGFDHTWDQPPATPRRQWVLIKQVGSPGSSIW